MQVGIKKFCYNLLITILLTVAGCSNILGACKKQKTVSTVKPVRGIWIATVAGLDWPPLESLKTETPTKRIFIQKQGLINALNNMVKIGINTFFFKLSRTGRPCGTQVYCHGQMS